MMRFDSERLKPTSPRFRIYINGGRCSWYVDTEKEAKDYIKRTKLADKKMHREQSIYRIEKEGE